jgi:hypothetical protein
MQKTFNVQRSTFNFELGTALGGAQTGRKNAHQFLGFFYQRGHELGF